MGRPTHDEVAYRWVFRMLGDNSRPLRNHNMFSAGDVLYSYGRHFPLAVALRRPTRRGRRGEVYGFLLNGDTFSRVTGRHQSATRTAVTGRGTVVIIPFSALDAAGVEYADVQVVDVLPDRTEVKHFHSTERPTGSAWRIDKMYHRVPRTSPELEELAAERWRERLTEYADALGRYQSNLEARQRPWLLPSWRRNGWTSPQPTYPRPYTVDDLDTYDRDVTVFTYARRLYTRSNGGTEIDVERGPGGAILGYHWETHRHWLGESLIRARIGYPVRRRCRDCGGFGTHPHTLELDYWGEVPYHRLRCSTCSGSGRVTQIYHRTATFLSGFDHNETRNLYFFSELPDNTAQTVEQAYVALKPDTVRLAEQMGRHVCRQGDIFAVPILGLDKQALRRLGAIFEKRGTLLGTNHQATEVAYLPGGRTLARGTLTHAPAWRRPDHRRVTLPKNIWHLTVKNTVPIGA